MFNNELLAHWCNLYNSLSVITYHMKEVSYSSLYVHLSLPCEEVTFQMNPVYKKFTNYTLDLYQSMQRRSVKLACISQRVILVSWKKLFDEQDW